MFNCKTRLETKLEDFENRIKLLEGNVGQDNKTWQETLKPDREHPSTGSGAGLPVRTVIRDIFAHLKLEYKTTPADTKLVSKK